MMVSDYLHRKAAARKVPLNGAFELSPVCNFSCRMCYVRRTPDQLRREGKALIPWQAWLELGRQCREAGMLYLLLTGGEPFLYPGFRALYEGLHRMGLILSINTNGSCIDEEAVAWLKTMAPGRVNVTLYGASPETYSRICGNPDGFARAIRAIRLLKEAGIPVVINASMIPENGEDLEKIAAIGRKLELNTRISTYMFPPVRRQREAGDSRFTPSQGAGMYLRRLRCQLSPQDYCRIVQKHTTPAPAESEAGDWGGDREGDFMHCRAGRCSFWVSWEGSMTACGMMDFPLTVYPFREPFPDCWLRLTEAVRSTPVLGGCAGCEKRELCMPCVAMIHGETGTVDEKAPYLCQMTDEILTLLKKEAASYGER